MRLGEYAPSHPLIATLEDWERESRDLADYDTAVLLAQHLACAHVPYSVLLKLSEHLANTLKDYGDDRFRKIITYGIDSLGANAINRACQAGRKIVVQAVHVWLVAPETPHLAFRLYATFSGATANDFAAWVALVYPKIEYQMQDLEQVILRRVPADSTKLPHAIEWEVEL